jgi:hypothetical protein
MGMRGRLDAPPGALPRTPGYLDNNENQVSGRCLCGAVTLSGGPVLSVQTCHCRECRAMSGHVWASVEVPLAGAVIGGPIRWFAASDRARRGFCPVCGAFVVWQANGGDRVEFALGALAQEPGAPTAHEFLAQKGDYYPWGPA